MKQTIKIEALRSILIDLYQKDRGIHSAIDLNEIFYNICNSLNIPYSKLSDEVFK